MACKIFTDSEQFWRKLTWIDTFRKYSKPPFHRVWINYFNPYYNNEKEKNHYINNEKGRNPYNNNEKDKNPYNNNEKEKNPFYNNEKKKNSNNNNEKRGILSAKKKGEESLLQ